MYEELWKKESDFNVCRTLMHDVRKLCESVLGEIHR
jgi:hypothetical protein